MILHIQGIWTWPSQAHIYGGAWILWETTCWNIIKCCTKKGRNFPLLLLFFTFCNLYIYIWNPHTFGLQEYLLNNHLSSYDPSPIQVMFFSTLKQMKTAGNLQFQIWNQNCEIMNFIGLTARTTSIFREWCCQLAAW